VNRVLIFAPNWLGDTIMALPAIADVARGLPDAVIAVAARRSLAPLLRIVPYVDDVVETAGWTDVFRPPISRGRFDVAILLPNSFRAALTAFRDRTPERWGYRTDGRGLLLTKAIERPPAGMHQVQQYRQLVNALGFANGPDEPRIELTSEVRDRGRRSLERAGWDGRAPIVALAPGAAYGASKRWPLEYFVGLTRRLAADGMQPAIVGGIGDAATGEAIRRALGDLPVLSMIGASAPDLPTLAGALVHARLLISNDSGPLHLGAAVGLPAVAMFGPTDERITAPRTAVETEGDRLSGAVHRKVVVLTHPVWCRPCWLRECPLSHDCLRGIDVETVLGAARQML
jgi:heptosyltransferase-2